MKISIKKAGRFFIILAVGALSATLVMFILLGQKKDKLLSTIQDFKYLGNVVDELWEVSASLTDYSRLYVASGDIKYYNDYKGLLAWRNGEAPRPTNTVKIAQGKQISQVELLKQGKAIPEEIALYEKSMNASQNLAKLELQAMESVRTGRWIQGSAKMHEGETVSDFAVRILFDDHYQSEIKKIQEPLDSLSERFELRSEKILKHEKMLFNVYSGITMACLVLTAIAILLLLFFVSTKLFKPVLLLSTTFNELGRGNLTVTMNENDTNEIGAMARKFNGGLRSLKDLVVVIKKNSAFLDRVSLDLASNINEMTTSIGQIHIGIDETKSDMQTQSSSVTKTAGTVEEMIRTIRSLSENIQVQSSSIVEASSSVEQMIENIAQITRTLENNNELMKNLNEQTTIGKNGVQQANSVITKIAERTDALMAASSVIQNIAGQTNLLAMNAAIEAAHAGDSGKGFAVVADEIRKLAEESNTQGREISKVLKETTAIIKSLVTAGSAAEHALEKTFELSEKIAEQENNITLSMREQANGSNEVLVAMREINETTQQVHAGSKEMLVGSEAVANEMKQLNELTSNINERMVKVAAGTTKIDSAIDQVNKLTEQNKNMIQHLNKEVGRFTV